MKILLFTLLVLVSCTTPPKKSCDWVCKRTLIGGEPRDHAEVDCYCR